MFIWADFHIRRDGGVKAQQDGSVARRQDILWLWFWWINKNLDLNGWDFTGSRQKQDYSQDQQDPRNTANDSTMTEQKTGVKYELN